MTTVVIKNVEVHCVQVEYVIRGLELDCNSSFSELTIKLSCKNSGDIILSKQAPDGVTVLFREVAQFGRALGLGPCGRRFESCLPD